MQFEELQFILWPKKISGDKRRTGVALLKQIRFDKVAINLQLRWKVIELEATDPCTNSPVLAAISPPIL